MLLSGCTNHLFVWKQSVLRCVFRWLVHPRTSGVLLILQGFFTCWHGVAPQFLRANWTLGDCSCYTACALLLFGQGCPGLCDQRHSKALGDFISLIYVAHYSSVCAVSRRNVILSGVLKPSAHSSLLALRVTGCLSARSARLLNDHIPTLCKC